MKKKKGFHQKWTTATQRKGDLESMLRVVYRDCSLTGAPSSTKMFWKPVSAAPFHTSFSRPDVGQLRVAIRDLNALNALDPMGAMLELAENNVAVRKTQHSATEWPGPIVLGQ